MHNLVSMANARVRTVTAVLFLGQITACLSLPAQGHNPGFHKSASSEQTITNPLLPAGPDPWVTSRNGYYYYMNTTGHSLVIWKTRHIGDLKTAKKKVIWTPPAEGSYSHDIWAPELHFLSEKWYVYFAADAGTNHSHRLWVLENPSSDPLQGTWTLKGKLNTPSDRWAIDGSVFENHGKLYLVWSGWAGDENGTQSIYLAQMSNPWTVEGKRIIVSTPTYPWEKIGDRPDNRANREANPGANTDEPLHIDVNEGPEVLQHGDKVFLIYSGSACWTNFYELGMVQASASSDLMDPASWTKAPLPVFWESPEAHAYGTGHNGFFKSPDGKQDWIIYHANSEPNQGCGQKRSPRAQPFTWNADGTPDFGRPVPLGTPLPAPSGEGMAQ